MKKIAKKTARKTAARPYVVIRAMGAGVHVGEIVSKTPTEVELVNARRLWRWFGANTLNEVAIAGVAANSRVSAPIGRITISGWCEIIECTPAARANLEAAKWAP